MVTKSDHMRAALVATIHFANVFDSCGVKILNMFPASTCGTCNLARGPRHEAFTDICAIDAQLVNERHALTFMHAKDSCEL